MPIDISNALALGFRNAPRLYGDQTVRPPPHKIIGARSGLRAAKSELFLGFYDGLAGLVRAPLPRHAVGRASLVGNRHRKGRQRTGTEASIRRDWVLEHTLVRAFKLSCESISEIH